MKSNTIIAFLIPLKAIVSYLTTLSDLVDIVEMLKDSNNIINVCRMDFDVRFKTPEISSLYSSCGWSNSIETFSTRSINLCKVIITVPLRLVVHAMSGS